MNNANDKRLFWACFIALVTTSFGFVIRALIMDEWATEFGLTETQKGEIFGVGLWPFAISIVLFSLIIDKIGYGRAIVFAFVCHAASAIITIATPWVPQEMWLGQKSSYWMLYIGNFIVALGNGTVEAVINPVVATMFPREKTKWLNILHAGWPGGLVLGGVLTIALSNPTFAQPLTELGGRLGLTALWQWKVALLFIPLLAYGLLMLGCTFPVNERVAAGVPYREMLQEAGILSAMVVVALMVAEVGRVFGVDWRWQVGIGALLLAGYGLYVQSLGRLMFFFLVLIMIPLATTELGTDSWITDLMKPEMTKLGLHAGWVLVYTSLIMVVLRFFAGPIVHALSPLGLLAISSAIAAVGLVSLSMSGGLLILAAATLYGFGKTFFWPTMLGVVSEQFPKGGALTLNMISGIGMLGVGVVGAAFLGNIQDRGIDRQLQAKDPALYGQVIGAPKQSVFGEYRPLDDNKVKTVPQSAQDQIKEIKTLAQKNALFTVALFPCIMLVCYLILIAYFKAKGGYKAEVLAGHTPKEKEDEFTGGIVGPADL